MAVKKSENKKTPGQKQREKTIAREKATEKREKEAKERQQGSSGGGGGGGGGGGSAPAPKPKKSKKERNAEKMASRKGGEGTPGYERRLRAWRKEYGLTAAGGGGGGGGSYGGGGGSSVVPPPPGKMEPPPPGKVEPPELANTPSWWRMVLPKEGTPQSQFWAMANMMLPYLSPDDQRTIATHLFTSNPTDFAHLDPSKIKFAGPPGMYNAAGEINPESRMSFFGQARAQQALKALDALRGAMGKSEADLGPGYTWLKSLLGTMQQFGASGNLPNTSGNWMVPTQMTRMQARNMLGALDPLLGMADSEDLAAFGPLAQALTQPFLAGGELMPFTRGEGGEYMFGKKNRRLFF